MITLRDQICHLQQNEKRLENKVQLEMNRYEDKLKNLQHEKENDLNSIRKQLEDKIEKRDTDLNTLKEHICEMEKHKVQLNEIILANIVEMECIICQDIYKFPVALPCGHVVCMICLYTNMKVKYSYQEQDFKLCPECRRSFELHDVVKLFCGIDEVSNRLAAAAQVICDPGQYSSLDDWNRDRKRSEECYKEMAGDNGRTMIQKWYDIKYGYTSISNQGNYYHLLYEKEEEEDKNAEYLLVKGTVASDYLSRTPIGDGGKSRYEKEEAAILRRMNEFAKPNEIAPSKKSLEKWLRHCSHELGNRPNDIPLFGFNRSDSLKRKTEMKNYRQYMFNSYFSKNYGDWQRISQPQLQSMYDVKMNLRRNWIFLGLEPDIKLFDFNEEKYCEEQSRLVWKNKRKRYGTINSRSSNSNTNNPSSNNNSSETRQSSTRPHNNITIHTSESNVQSSNNRPRYRNY